MKLADYVQLISLSSKSLWAISVACVGLLVVNHFEYVPVPEDYEWAIGVVWTFQFFAVALLIVRYVDSRIRRAKVIAGLDRLTQEECSLLKEAIHSGSPSVRTSRHSATAGHLVSLGVLVRVEGDFANDDWPYSIPDFVWPKVLMQKSDILDKADTIVLKNGKGTIEIRKS